MAHSEDRALNLFVSCAPEDAQLRDSLLKHLAIFLRLGNIRYWGAETVPPGADTQYEAEQALESADVALLLLSANSLSSDLVQDVELPRLIARHNHRGLRVIPVLMRTCAWQHHPWLGKLTPLPRSGRAIAAYDADSRDQVLTEVVEEIATLVRQGSTSHPSSIRANGNDAQLPPVQPNNSAESYSVPGLPESALAAGTPEPAAPTAASTHRKLNETTEGPVEPPQAHDDLLRAISAPDVTRTQALVLLDRLIRRGTSATPLVLKATFHRDPEVRAKAEAFILSNIDDAVRALDPILPKANDGSLSHLFHLLARMGPPARVLLPAALWRFIRFVDTNVADRREIKRFLNGLLTSVLITQYARAVRDEMVGLLAARRQDALSAIVDVILTDETGGPLFDLPLIVAHWAADCAAISTQVADRLGEVMETGAHLRRATVALCRLGSAGEVVLRRISRSQSAPALARNFAANAAIEFDRQRTVPWIRGMSAIACLTCGTLGALFGLIGLAHHMLSWSDTRRVFAISIASVCLAGTICVLTAMWLSRAPFTGALLADFAITVGAWLLALGAVAAAHYLATRWSRAIRVSDDSVAFILICGVPGGAYTAASTWLLFNSTPLTVALAVVPIVAFALMRSRL